VVRLFRGSRVEIRVATGTGRSLLRGDGKVPGGCKGYGFHDFAKG
jgi:hypothetical protein